MIKLRRVLLQLRGISVKMAKNQRNRSRNSHINSIIMQSLFVKREKNRPVRDSVRGRTRTKKVVLVFVRSTTSPQVKWSYLVLSRTRFTFCSVVLVLSTTYLGLLSQKPVNNPKLILRQFKKFSVTTIFKSTRSYQEP